MAGVGPAPKPSERRARRRSGANSGEMRVIEITPMSQPALPDSMGWPEETEKWWAMWADSPLAADFSSTDWSFLLDTAILHAQLWGNGDTTVLAELRIRVAKFGATPEDRARLRIQFAQADEAETRTETRRGANSRARGRASKLKAVGD